ncbi:uncharacterized protein LOC111916777 [Lactuca sativa]|uniref:uncharacterized protein LOC111916777 n=1 Tax=Lactuca sativa TaxID=4236 RepID=UPI000CD93D88|nr:uncharacterized protein LOC111916777 [Lactuca sativa]
MQFLFRGKGVDYRGCKALILLLNRKIVAIKETLALFMELQVLTDKPLKELAFSHIKRMNQKHKNETEKRALQSILFSMLQEEDEQKAMRSLVTICDLHRRKDYDCSAVISS